MGADPEKASRKPRADSLRNHELLLDAARVIFSTGGPEASLEAVARRAAVGVGTLYRHFPTREALFQAVYKREVDELVDLAERLLAEAGPVAALRLWLRRNVQMVATKRGMLAALAPAKDSAAALYADSSKRLLAAVGSLIDRAVAAGEIRGDIAPQDLMRTMYGLCYAGDQPGWAETVIRLLDVFVDGMRVVPANSKAG